MVSLGYFFFGNGDRKKQKKEASWIPVASRKPHPKEALVFRGDVKHFLFLITGVAVYLASSFRNLLTVSNLDPSLFASIF